MIDQRPAAFTAPLFVYVGTVEEQTKRLST